MPNPRALVRRRKAVSNTRKITKTMEMVSTARMARAQAATLAARPFARRLREIIGDVAAHSTGIKHPLLEEHTSPRTAVVVVLTSDRGLCGAFNANIIRQVRALHSKLKARGLAIEYLVQGKKGVAAFRYLQIPVTKSYLLVSDKPSYARAEEIAGALIGLYTQGAVDEAYIVYSQFRNLVSQVPKAEKLLPLTALETPAQAPEARRALSMGYLFHPGAERILSELLPQVVMLSLFTAMLDNAAGEHSARHVAMKNATEAADEMIKKLTQTYNRARQGKITQEISEIVGGAEAL